MTIGSQVSVIFKQKPTQWGLRGDPFLWEDLESYFTKYPLTIGEAEFCIKIEQYIAHLVENHPMNQDAIFIEQYAHGGLSSGCISLSFWNDVAIPMLLSRLRRILTTGKGDM